MSSSPPERPCTAREDGPECQCETCVNIRAESVRWDAIHIGHFGSAGALADHIEAVWLHKIDGEPALLPTGEAGHLTPQELVLLWLQSDVVATDGMGDYFWHSARHAAFWGCQ